MIPRLLAAGKKTLLLLLTVAALAMTVSFQNEMFLRGRDYYASLSTGLASALGDGAVQNDRPLGNCDIETCIQQLAGTPQGNGDVKVGACDLFMFNGSVSVAFFLAFLQVYLAFLLLAYLTVGLLPRALKKPAVLLWSLGFMLVALPIQPAVWLMGLASLTYTLLSLPVGGRLRAVLVFVTTCGFYLTLGHNLVERCAPEYFSVSRIYFTESMLYRVYQIFGLHGAQLNELVVNAHLGQINMPRMHDQGFPYLFLALAFMIKQFRRMLWVTYELWTDRLPPVGPLDFALYYVGLPTLMGNAATPSLRMFVDAYSTQIDVPVRGAQTIAWCMGGGTLFYATIAMLGYFPAVRVLFPNCDINTAGPSLLWGKLCTQYVVQYLFLMATEQASLGVARLFGYNLRDNYDQPFIAHSPAEFWRRWNIYFREYHVALTFLPTALWLARKQGEQRRWHLAVAGAVTFFWTFVLNLMPLALLGGLGQVRWLASFGHQTGTDLINKELAQVGQWQQYIPSLATYYVIEGLAVSLCLIYEFRKPRVPTQRLSPPRLAVRIAGMVVTFLFIAAARCFLDTNLSFEQQTKLLGRAFGIIHH